LLQSSCRILIADDYEAIRAGVRTILEVREGWLVIAEASCGPDALKLAHETKPDIAVLAYALPQMNGVDLTRNIKQALPDTEVLLYSMYDQESVVVEALRAGARGYVLKSDPASHLIAAIEATIRRKPYFSPVISETVLEQLNQRRDAEGSIALTPREREVVQLIAEGKINKQVAYMLDISMKTVETHRAAVMQKLKLRTTAQLVLYAVRNNIVVV
jgi:DNA-binding NarL/FixJ family response regulator